MKDNVEIVKSLISIVAIIVGGIWTYYLFVNDRLAQPRADISVNFQCHNISEEKRLVYITSTIKNQGNSVLRSRNANMRLRQILPLTENIQENVDRGYDIVLEGKTDADWIAIAQRDIAFKKNGFLIEPNESGEIQKEFVINRSVEAVEVYFYLDNESNRNGGWSRSMFYVFNDSGSSNKAMQLTACSGS